MPKLVIIGIDGMDPFVFEQIQAELPYLASIKRSGCFKHCPSVFPPDSIPAWVTIFTGEHPAKHGWLDNIDYEDIRRGAEANKLCDLQGNTFWDRLSQAGKRVCVVNPLLAYPAWPVNGVMASGPVFITGEKQIYPPALAAKYELPELGGMTDFPTESALNSFLGSTLQSTRDLARFGLNLLTAEPWDLFFISFFTLDRIQHFLWRFWDKTDPLYPGHSTLQNGIIQAYKEFDEIVGDFIKNINPEDSLIVLSDHGHGQRPTMLINLNEDLRQAGLLKTVEEKNKSIPLKKWVEITKNLSIKMVVKVLGERWLYRIGRLLPKKTRKALKKSSYLLDRENSLAWVSEMGGGASVGGITINPSIDRMGPEYKMVTASILERLETINQSAGDLVVQWVKLSEKDDFYPDVIFELSSQYSAGRSMYCPILEKNPRHRIISGGHKKEGVFFALNALGIASNVDTISDFSNAILASMLSLDPVQEYTSTD